MNPSNIKPHSLIGNDTKMHRKTTYYTGWSVITTMKLFGAKLLNFEVMHNFIQIKCNTSESEQHFSVVLMGLIRYCMDIIILISMQREFGLVASDLVKKYQIKKS